jgi:inhibitor of KinA sporulation pathway (predicted exonuclease)
LNNQIILFDFEYTAWEGSHARKWSEPWEHREIIQIAAIRVTLDAAVEEIACFDCFVKPTHNPILSSYIIGLTGIDQPAIDTRGVCFAQAWAAFNKFCEAGRIPLFCYGDDPAVLAENFALNDMRLSPFPAGVYDIRVVFEAVGIDTSQYTSGTVHQAVSAQFNHAAHNALNDVRSLAATIRQLVSTGQIRPAWVAEPMAWGDYGKNQ